MGWSCNNYDGRTYVFTWWNNGQSTSGNYTNIGYQLYASGGKHNMYAERNMNLVVNGSKVYSRASKVERWVNTSKDNHIVYTGSATIYHNSNGTGSFSASMSCSVYTSAVNIWGSGSWSLPTIARASTPTASSSSVSLGGSITLYANRKSTSFSTSMSYTFNGYSLSKGLSKNSNDSYTFSPPYDLASYKTNGTSATATFSLTTYNGGSSIGTNSVSVTVNIPSDIKPTTNSLTVTDPTGYKDHFGGYIEGRSKYKVSTSGSGTYGSSVTQYEIQANGQTVYESSMTSGVVKSGYTTIKSWTKDSRGRWSDAKTVTTTILPYFYPKIHSFSISRCDADGTKNDMGNNAFVSYSVEIAPIDNKNTKNLKLYYKPIKESEWAELNIPMEEYTKSGQMIINNIDDTKSYQFQIYVDDYFNDPTYYTLPLSTAACPMDFGAEGHGVSIGETCEGPGFTVAMESYFKNPLNMLVTGRRPRIEAGENLNNYVYPGCWGVYATADAKSIGNIPTAQAGLLTVMSGTGDRNADQVMINSWTNIIQFYMAYDGYSCWVRKIYSSSTPGSFNYGNWAKIWG